MVDVWFPARHLARTGVPEARFATSARPAWLRPKQTDLVPGKGQFRSRFHDPLSYCCPTTIFRDPRNRHRHHLILASAPDPCRSSIRSRRCERGRLKRAALCDSHGIGRGALQADCNS